METQMFQWESVGNNNCIIDFIQPEILSRWVDHNNDFMISAGIVNTNEYISTIVGADYDEEEQQGSESGTDSVEANYSSDQEVDNEAAMTSEDEDEGQQQQQQQDGWFYLGDC